MIKYNLARARLAVQYLVDSSYYLHHLRKLKSTLKRPRALPFKDEAECLNELVIIGRQSEQALENLLEIAAFKRDDRNAYQRNFMAEKRARDKKIVELEEMLQGGKLTVDERCTVILKQYTVWKREKGLLLSKLEGVSWEGRNQELKAFWERKEQEIEQLIVEAQNAQARHKRRRYLVEVPPKPTLIRTAMKKAVDKYQ